MYYFSSFYRPVKSGNRSRERKEGKSIIRMTNTNIIRKLWNNYKYRFVPWLSLQIPETKNLGETGSLNSHKDSTDSSPSIRVHHLTKNEDLLMGDRQLQLILGDLFANFMQAKSLGKKNDDELESIHQHNREVMTRKLGFTLQRRESSLGPNAGSGIFIEGGTVKAGSLVALYPGTIYLPSEPLLLASIRNQFIFRCKDGILIDGNDRGISKSIYKSCAMRDKFNIEISCCDTSWLMSRCSNPLNVALWQFLPNVWYNPNHNNSGIRLVPLVAVRDIEENEELFSAYFTVVHD
ncbi:unnamed protein product [Allacma fusca]|uniref:SET domain-containing protein n=1 Tax=Allacma fusca TaxID=39272 RepID=A0A8J2LJU4_9HEXA|nr:unnamed protein product [Allacma fusca]